MCFIFIYLFAYLLTYLFIYLFIYLFYFFIYLFTFSLTVCLAILARQIEFSLACMQQCAKVGIQFLKQTPDRNIYV